MSPNPEKSKVFLPAAGGDFFAPLFSSRKKVEINKMYSILSFEHLFNSPSSPINSNETKNLQFHPL